MQQFEKRNPSTTLASLNNKTITIEDYEFSTLAFLCGKLDERKTKANGQICILVRRPRNVGDDIV